MEHLDEIARAAREVGQRIENEAAVEEAAGLIRAGLADGRVRLVGE